MKTRTYVIFRHGSDKANQPMCDVAVLGTVEAQSQDRALDRAWLSERWSIYANQYFTACPVSRCTASDVVEAEECDRYE